MGHANDKMTGPRGTTIVELTVAVAIVATVFAAVMPLFAGVRNSADTRWANLEMIQNARILNEQLCRCLAGAWRITDMSTGTNDDGYIQFEVAGGTAYRCALGPGGRIEFGPVGDPDELVGPVEYLRFICYDANDLIHPARTPDGVRLVTWETRLHSAGRLARGRVVRGACCLRVAAGAGTGGQIHAIYDFATGRPGVDRFAFTDSGTPPVPERPDLVANPYGIADYDAVEAHDGQFHVMESSDEGDFARVRLTFEIAEKEQDLEAIAALWNGRGVNAHSSGADGASLHIWNYRARCYELLEASPDTDAEIALAGSRSSNAANYVGGAGGRTIVLLIVSNDRKAGNDANALFTDCVRVDVTASAGGAIVAP